jgi:hypothetical protein
MARQIDVRDGPSEIWHAYQEITPSVDFHAPYACGTIADASGTQAPKLKNKAADLAADARFGPLFWAMTRDVAVNNLGNLVVPAGDDGKETLIVDTDQQTPDYLSMAVRSFDHARETLHVEKALPLVRPGDHIYGHWLIDILPKLWLFLQANDLGATKLILRQNTPEFARKMLAFLGVGKESLVYFNHNRHNLKVDRAFYVTNLRKNQMVHPKMAEFSDAWCRTLLKDAPEGWQRTAAGASKKVFISRGTWQKPHQHRVCHNNAEIEAQVAAFGDWTIYHPQNDTLSQQAAVFSEAEVIMGEEGSGMHNSLLMPKGAEVVTLRSPHNHSMIQGGLCRVRQQSEHVAFGAVGAGGKVNRNVNFSVDPALLREIQANLGN